MHGMCYQYHAISEGMACQLRWNVASGHSNEPEFLVTDWPRLAQFHMESFPGQRLAIEEGNSLSVVCIWGWKTLCIALRIASRSEDLRLEEE